MIRDENFKVKRKELLLAILLLSIISALTIFLSNNQISAVGETSVCCERTVQGAWCQSSPPAECAGSPYRTSPTSCEATSYCRLGTCVNSQEGTCLPNTPQKVCQDNNGVWKEGKPEDIPQCQLGCCIIGEGEQTAFVTQTQCKSIAGAYGVGTNWRSDIKTEAACIASANPQARGACVLDDGFSRNCRLLTKQECQQLETTSASDTNVEFHEGFLCSAESLATNCGIPKNPKTTCVEDKDQVYFLDTCGNLGNVYDASKVKNPEYWTKIKEPSESCNPSSSNAGSASCGNCDYLAGSTCKEYKRGSSLTPTKPNYGDFVCADLSCNYQGEKYQHGETWCASPGADLPGSEYFRLSCYNGEVETEQCDPRRATVCIQNQTEDGYKFARCEANLWQDCFAQNSSADCENTAKRDCQWVIGQSIITDSNGKPLVVNENDELVPQGQGKKFPIGNIGGIIGSILSVEKGAACVPKNAPGFDFWNPDGEAKEFCIYASQNCVVKIKNPIGPGGWKCDENCECVGLREGESVAGGINAVAQWVSERNNLCVSIGDCGDSKNYIGIQGYQSGGGVATRTRLD
ncbi:MAG: hypothetical protein Q8P79_03710 [Nanoarchaeota archaeon]|nr:hypothetical protein [Nanoarchaeota archaeon]